MLKRIVLIILIFSLFGLIAYKFLFSKIDFNNKSLNVTVVSYSFTMEKREIKAKDNKNIEWDIVIDDNTIFKKKINFETGIKIKITGEKKENQIIAKEISPL